MCIVASKSFKELETRLHERLYDNIKLLTFTYPTNKDFDLVFSKTMFVKNNKAAFHQVIYYLFTILDPQHTREKITWPLYEVKMETTFRTDVVAFIKHLNVKYEHSNVPNMMPSQLVSPGGFRFAKFMLKLSLLATHVHLSKNEDFKDELLLPVKSREEANILVINNLKFKTGFIKQKVEQQQQQLVSLCQEAGKEATEIFEEQNKVNKDFSGIEKSLTEKEELRNCPTEDVLSAQLEQMKEKMVKMEQFKKLCDEGKKLLNSLSDEQILEFKAEDLVIPDAVKNLLITSEVLDLHRLFESLGVVLENEILDMPVFTQTQVPDMVKNVSDFNDRLSEFSRKLSMQKNELMETSGSNLGLDVKGNKIPKIVVIPFG